MNSMYDFIECADFLVKNGYAHKDRMAAKGISAGGLLVASAINMRTDLFRAAILKVLFLSAWYKLLDLTFTLLRKLFFISTIRMTLSNRLFLSNIFIFISKLYFQVPFIDICNTMLDDSLALTVSDYEEWGNPARKDIFEYIRHYSPYDNVKKNVPYPAMLVLSSFLDTR